MRRFLVASATAALFLAASFATTASAATYRAQSYYAPSLFGPVRVSTRHVQKHPFYRAWGNHYGFGPGHHQY